MIDDALDRSSSARLAKASERLNILAHELHIAVADDADAEALAAISDHLSSQALDLAEIVFTVAEDAVASSGDPRAERSAAALGRVSRIVEPVFEVASEVAAHLVTAVRRADREERALAARDLVALDLPIAQLLEDDGHLITGAGVAMAPRALVDEELWMQWWVRTPDGPERLAPQLDRRASRFYDYPSAVWFSESARDLAPHLAPPHFDDGGTDAWMVTATVPVVVRGALVGLACAELTLERIGALATPALEALPTAAALVSPEGLVVASTHPGLRPGEAVPDDRWQPTRGSSAAFAEVAPGLTVAHSPALPWLVLADWSS